MAAVTTVPGFGAPSGPAIPRYALRGATPRSRQVAPSTYRRRRLAVATLALGLAVVAAQAGAALGGLPLASPERRSTVATATRAATAPVAPGSAAGPAGSPEVAGTVVVVREGDSLWSIAARLAPADADLRGIVDELSDARDGAPLVPGETIRVSD
jgi:nucleoid-associated protein YgaU